MELALYHPEQGYYATRAREIGAKGDFFTSPHLGADFGELLTEQFVQMWQILGQPQPFTLVEMGAGQGVIAGDVLAYAHTQHPDFFADLDYVIVEKAAALIAQQQAYLKPWPQVRWTELADVAPDSITGCCFSNELVDAFPVHRLLRQGTQLQELYVTLDAESSKLQEVPGPLSTPQLAAYFQFIGVDLLAPEYPVGYQTEVNLLALDWMKSVARCLQRGYVLTIDYGYPARQYYSPARQQGTLQCYFQHRSHSDPYINLGQQDITAHVDFTALERQGQSLGLELVGLTQQGMFLMGLGLGDRLVTNNTGQSDRSIAEVIRYREAIHQLMNPLGLGGFSVLVQQKGLTNQELAQSLLGLQSVLET